MQDLQPGDIFDNRYRVEHRLGQGGSAEVWLATELESTRRVALKILKLDEGDRYAANTRARFEREVKIIAGLRDPHTVTLFHHGEWNGRLYLVFEYVPGHDLSELLRQRGRLTQPEVVHIVRQLLSSLREAHEMGLIHRDLKPENVRVFDYASDPLTVRLLDFGIARASDDGHPSLTKTGELIGTPRYMSPEQLTGEALTPASDIYSLGMLMYGMLAGDKALPGTRWGDQLDRLQHRYALTADTELHGSIQTIVQRMTAREPVDRYQGVHAVVAALDRLEHRATRTVPSLATAPREPPRTWWRYAVVLAVLLGVVGGLWAFLAEDQPPQAPVIIEKRANPLVRGHLSAEAEPEEDRPAAPDVGLDLDLVPLADASVIPSPGCGRPPPHIGRGRELNGNVTFLPRDYDPSVPRPLVIAIHPEEAGPRKFSSGSGLVRLADEHRFTVVAPVGSTNQLLGRDVYFGVWGQNAENIVRAAFESVRNEVCVDEARVFIIASGDGGRMTRHMRCEPWVAAIATNGFLETGTAPSHCETPVPAMWIVPTESIRLLTNGSPGCSWGDRPKPRLSIAQLEREWLQRNRCPASPSDEFIAPNGTCRTWAESCAAPFALCEVKGGEGWTTSSDRQDLVCRDPPPADFPRAEKVWEFFENAVPRTPSSE